MERSNGTQFGAAVGALVHLHVLAIFEDVMRPLHHPISFLQCEGFLVAIVVSVITGITIGERQGWNGELASDALAVRPPHFVYHVTEVVSSEIGAGGVDIEPRLGRVHGNRCELTWDDRNIDAARHPRESNLKDFVGAWITPVLFGNGLVDVLGVKCVHVPRVTVAGFDPVEGPGIGQNNVVVSIHCALHRSHPIEHVVLRSFAGLSR